MKNRLIAFLASSVALVAPVLAIQISDGDYTGTFSYSEAVENQPLYFGWNGGTWDPQDVYQTYAITLSHVNGPIYMGYSDTGVAQPLTGTILGAIHLATYADSEVTAHSSLYFNNAATITGEVRAYTSGTVYFNNSGNIGDLALRIDRLSDTEFTVINTGTAKYLEVQGSGDFGYACTGSVTNAGSVYALDVTHLDNAYITMKKGSSVEAFIGIGALSNATLHVEAQAFVVRDDGSGDMAGFFAFAGNPNQPDNRVVMDLESSSTYASIKADYVHIQWEGDGTFDGNVDLILNFTGGAEHFLLGTEMVLFESLTTPISGGFANIKDGDTVTYGGQTFTWIVTDTKVSLYVGNIPEPAWAASLLGAFMLTAILRRKK